jgi:hypothetical protein
MTKNLRNNRAAISKMLIVAVVVVIIIIAAAAGAYYFLGQNPASPSTNPTATPTGNPTETPGETTSPSSSTDVAGASSLQYSVSLTQDGVVQGSYTYYGKNAGTDNFAMRIEYQDQDGTGVYIFNEGTREAWTNAGDQWVDMSSYFDSQFQMWDNLWTGYVNNLASWAGTGDYSYSANGNTVRIYDISVNPPLADSLFTHS